MCLNTQSPTENTVLGCHGVFRSGASLEEISLQIHVLFVTGESYNKNIVSVHNRILHVLVHCMQMKRM